MLLLATILICCDTMHAIVKIHETLVLVIQDGCDQDGPRFPLGRKMWQGIGSY